MSGQSPSAVAWAHLARFRIRLDRLRILTWILVGLFLTAMVAATWDSLYPTAAERVSFAATLQAAPALTALLGPLQAPESTGGLTTWRVGGIATLLMGIVIVFLVVRNTRADMATGRAELLLSGRLRRSSVISAGVAPAVVLALGVGLACTGALGLAGRGWTGALIYGASIAGSLLLFAAVASLAAQAVNSTRGANGLGILLVVLAFIVTAIGFTRDSSILTDLTPFGWLSKASPFAQNRIGWALLPWLVAALVFLVSVALASRRDIGSAWVRQTLGPVHAARWLSNSAALLWRVDMGLILGWIGGLFALSLFMGFLTGSMTQLIQDSPQIQELMNRLAADSSASSLTPLVLAFTALGAAAYPISLLLRQANDEAEGRLELLLSTPSRRGQILGARLLEAFLGSIVLQVLVGIGVGTVTGFFADDRRQTFIDSIGYSVVALPAIWFIAALTALIVAAAPRLSWLSWLALAWCVVIGELGPLMNLPEWTQRLTPYWYNAHWPLDSTAGPALIMVVLATAMVVAAFVTFQRRGIPS
ncbi:MAG: hypothetical protein Q8L05_02835 [Actinomycetota bacterium]|nr:hypothetical protein [Actinomycetota bacterium]MDP2288507.1 hypothetical protein [Actinomycetota bacterium]